MGRDPDWSASTESAFRTEVADRFGLVPNFFCSAQAAPELIAELWGFARSGYLDSPLPSVFKERLFVHLSRFCETRYCIIRHVGFLAGLGHPAGDASAAVNTIEEVVALLSRAIPDSNDLTQAFGRLAGDAVLDLASLTAEQEADLFDALTVAFVDPGRSASARDAIRSAVGDRTFEVLIAYLAFIRTAHYWTETHPEICPEPDVIALMESRPDLAKLLTDPCDADRIRSKQDMRDVAAEPTARVDCMRCLPQLRM